MSDDAKLKAALSADDEQFLRDLEDGRGLIAKVGDSFHGPMRWWAVVCNVFVMIATGFGIWTVIKLLGADTTRGQILWAAAAWASWTMQIALKQWLWDRINMLTVLRELKKIELRLVRLEEGR